jgi:hypothetical protein
MKSSLSLVLATLVMPAALLVGCGGGGGPKKGDMAVPITPDMTTPNNCTTLDISTWQGFARFTPGDSTDNDDSGLVWVSPTLASGNVNIIFLDIYQVHGMPETVPQTVTFAATDDPFTQTGMVPDYGAHGVAVFALANNFDTMDPNGGGSGVLNFAPTSGTMKVTQADTTPTGGMAVTVSNLNIAAFTTSGELINGGACYTLASATLSSSPYIANPDGGTDM